MIANLSVEMYSRQMLALYFQPFCVQASASSALELSHSVRLVLALSAIGLGLRICHKDFWLVLVVYRGYGGKVTITGTFKVLNFYIW